MSIVIISWFVSPWYQSPVSIGDDDENDQHHENKTMLEFARQGFKERLKLSIEQEKGTTRDRRSIRNSGFYDTLDTEARGFYKIEAVSSSGKVPPRMHTVMVFVTNLVFLLSWIGLLLQEIWSARDV